MRINKIKFTNFKSFSSFELKFQDLNPGIYYVSGKNGSGKTSIAEGILFGLYGRTYGNGSVENFVKWGEKTTTVEINLTSNRKSIYIKRVTSLNKYATLRSLNVYIDGVQISAPSNRLMQDLLENEYYDIPEYIISTLCVIGFNNFLPISCLSSSTTKEYISKIFEMNSIDNWISKSKEKKKELNNILYDCNLQLSSVEGKLSFLKDTILNENVENTFKIPLQNLNIQKNEIEKSISLENDLFSIQNNELNTKHINISYIKNLQNSAIKVIEKNCICPICNSVLDKKQVKEISIQYDENLTQEKKLKNDLKSLNDNHSLKIKNLQNYLNKINSEISSLEKKEVLYNQKQQEYAKMSLEKDKFEITYENLKIEKNNNQKYISNIDKIIKYLDEFIRSEYIKIRLPQFNKKLTQYGKYANISDWQIIFDEHFDFKIKSNEENMPEYISPQYLSTGQRKIIDIIIILSLLSISTFLGRFNILFFDEIFANIDSEIKNNILYLLKDIAQNNDLNILITGHTTIPTEFVTDTIKI